MNIHNALTKLKLKGGHIYRDSKTIAIYQWPADSWEGFIHCRVTLSIEDLLSKDWKHVISIS